MPTSSFDQTFIISDPEAIKRFYEVYYDDEGVTIENLDEKIQELKDEAKEGIARLKRKFESKKNKTKTIVV